MADRADELAAGPDVTEVDDRADAQVPWRIFGAVGVFIAVIALVYGVTSGEHAGGVMLSVAAILGLWCGTFLWRNLRAFEAGTAHDEVDPSDAYLPEASPWPFGIGLGATLILNGLLIGSWFLVPGVMVLVLSLAGFARQSRHRR